MSDPIKNRYDFVVYFDCTNGNPNGDPDAGNLPRIDPETQKGLVTDVCLKRKIRNYVQDAKEGEPGFDIYIAQGPTLESKNLKAYAELGYDPANAQADDDKGKGKSKKKSTLKKTHPEADQKIRDYMCKNYYDIRTFGAVMTTFVQESLNCGQITGPVQITFAESVDPIIPQEHTITRLVLATEKEAESKSNTMGSKSMIPYGLYRAEGFVSANLARKSTGFSEEDLELLWQAIVNMFENDHSAARGKMAVQKLIVFKHDSEFGNYPSHKLFDAIKAEKKPDVMYPRKFEDYNITIDEEKIPSNVTMEQKI